MRKETRCKISLGQMIKKNLSLLQILFRKMFNYKDEGKRRREWTVHFIIPDFDFSAQEEGQKIIASMFCEWGPGATPKSIVKSPKQIIWHPGGHFGFR